MNFKSRRALTSLSLMAAFSTQGLAQSTSPSLSMPVINSSYLLFPICMINKDATAVKPVTIEISLYPKSSDSVTEDQMRKLTNSLYNMWTGSAFQEKRIFMRERLKDELIEAEVTRPDSEFKRVMMPFLQGKVSEVVSSEGLADKLDYSVGPISFASMPNIDAHCQKNLAKRQAERAVPKAP